MNARTARLLFTVAGLCVLAAVGWRYSVTDLVAVSAWSEQHWPIVLAGLFVLYLVRPFLLWPLSLFSVFVGYVFGIHYGLPLALLGTLVTSLPPFFLAARLDSDAGYLGWMTDTGAAVVETTGEVRGMIAARLSPAPADAVSYGAGLAGVSTYGFVVGTLVGELPWAVFYLLLGRSLRRFSVAAIDRSGADVGLVLVAVAVSVLLVARPLYDLVRERASGDDEPAT
jgi:uncharacterized membrane protein YdjX (TVP38/TMEM64 family)